MAAKQKRLIKELKECSVDQDLTGITATPVGESLEHLKGTLKGPKDTPYEKGVFTVDIQIPQEYPFKPPKMKFDTKVWHPNVSSQTGAICLDILSKEWSPALTIKTTLISLQLLLAEPVPDDPQDATVAGMYTSDIDKFNKTASEWTGKYAKVGIETSPVSATDIEARLENSSSTTPTSASPSPTTGCGCNIL